MMKCCTIIALVIVLSHPTAASAQLLETLAVPTDGSSTNSSTVLSSSSQYRLRASGTFDIGGPGDGLADAEYADFSDPPSSLIDFGGDGAIDLGIVINGSKPIWGAFAPTHVYNLSFVGTDSTLSASYNDSFYSDNSGTLTLDIILVPEPAGIVILSTAVCLAGVIRRR